MWAGKNASASSGAVVDFNAKTLEKSNSVKPKNAPFLKSNLQACCSVRAILADLGWGLEGGERVPGRREQQEKKKKRE